MNAKLVKLMTPRKALWGANIACITIFPLAYIFLFAYIETRYMWTLILALIVSVFYLYADKKYKAHIKQQTNKKGAADA